MDQIDHDIMKLLQENARISLSEISTHVDLSISAIGERIRKLENHGVIKKYTTVLNSRSLGKELTTFILVRFKGNGDYDNFMSFIDNNPSVTVSFTTTGSYDFCMQYVADNTSVLNGFIQELRRYSCVDVVETNIILDLKKIKPFQVNVAK